MNSQFDKPRVTPAQARVATYASEAMARMESANQQAKDAWKRTVKNHFRAIKPRCEDAPCCGCCQ